MTGHHNDPLAMCGSGPVDGDHSTLSSFWAEVQGQVALLIMMMLLDRRYIISMSQFHLHHRIEPKGVKPWESDSTHKDSRIKVTYPQ